MSRWLTCATAPGGCYVPTPEPKPLTNVDDVRGATVYVVTCIDNYRVVEQRVFASLFEADTKFKVLCEVWGGANVALTSRKVL